MKIFPHILVRLGGLPFDWMEDLSMQDNKSLEIYIGHLRRLQCSKSELFVLLEMSPEYLHCGFMLKSLYQLKMDLEKGRRMKLPARFDENLLESEQPFFEQAMKKVSEYRGYKKALINFRSDFEITFSAELSHCRWQLQKQSHSEVLKKGLLMSSRVLLSQLSKYQSKAIEGFRKKEGQTERAVLQYLSRICTKTSPFSTFTTLGIFSFHENFPNSTEARSVVRLNNDLFSLWRDILNHYPPFYFEMHLVLNPCLRKEKKGWTFLLNSRNVESVQFMESNDLLEYIINLFSEEGKNWTFRKLLQELTQAVEADTKALENYLLQLISYCLLEWRWPFSGLDPIWDDKMVKLMESRKPNDLLISFAEKLKRIQEIKTLFATADFENRQQYLQEAYQLVKEHSESLILKTQIIDNQQTIDLESFQRFKPGKFKLPIEKLFYEDITVPFQPAWKAEELKEVIEELDKLLSLLNNLSFNSKKENFKQFFNHHFESDSTVNLFAFYEAYYKTEHPKNADLKNSKIAQQLFWQEAIFSQLKVSKEGILKIDLPFLKALSEKPPTRRKRQESASIGTLIHFFKEEEQLIGFSETSFQGFGKMMGRFLHLFPEPITKALQDWNLELMGNLLWIENTDASLYNPNLHPPFLPYEIQMPGSQNTLPSDQQIPVIELAIIKDLKSDELTLIHEPSKQRVYIFDMGFEAPESRSPLYQMLLAFSYETTSQSVLTNIVNHYFLKETKTEIIQLPRIEIGDHLIIQRRNWLVPKDLLPLKPSAEKECDYFLRINTWRLENEIPTKVFITINQHAGKGSGIRKDDYKPQYIDFESPLFVQLFHKSIKKVEKQLKIEEVLPFAAERIGNQTFVSEYLVQWERGTKI